VGDSAGGSNGRDAGPLPTVGPENLIDTPVSRATAGSGAFPSVAFSGMEYFVAWTDGRAAEFQQVFGTRVSPDGRVLDPKGIAISDLLGESSSPSVVWDGTNYLVVYERAGAIVARRFGRDGVAVDSTSFTVAGGSNQTPTAVANGATTLAVWAEKTPQMRQNKIFAARIVGGAVVDPQPVAIQTGAGYPSPHATFGGGKWCICWSDGSGQQGVGTVRCSRVGGPTGQLLDTTSIVVASGVTDPYGTNQGISVSRPVVASDGTDYLVVYEEFRQAGGAQRLLGARLTSTGTLRDTAAIQLASTSSFQGGYSVAFNAGHYQVIWSDGGGPFGNRVDPATGSVLDGSNGLPIAGAAAQANPTIVSAGSGFYVTFTLGGGTAVMGARVTAEPAVLDGGGVPLIPSVTNSERDADIASDGVNHLLVWVDDRDGNKAVYGARLSGQTGAPLDPSALRLSSRTSNVVSPKVAFNGTNYLVVWADHRSPEGIYGARVAPDGTILDPGGRPLWTGISQIPTLELAVASDGENWFVVWIENSLPISGMRIAPGGAPLDPVGIQLASAPYSRDMPSVAFGAGSYFVVWRSNGGIQGERVSREGVPIDPLDGGDTSQMITSGQVYSMRAPSIAYADSSFLISNATFGVGSSAGSLAVVRVDLPSANQTIYSHVYRDTLLDCCTVSSSIVRYGNGYLITYASPAPNSAFQIGATRFEKGAPLVAIGTDLDPTDWFVDTSATVPSVGAVLSVAGGKAVAAYSHYDSTPGVTADRVGARVISDLAGASGGGSGGTGTGGGAAGAGGQGGGASVPECQTEGVDGMEFVLVDSSSMLMTRSPASSPVTVTAVDSCAAVRCEYGYDAVSVQTSGGATRISVAAGSQQWMIYLSLPEMPPDLFRVGDTFDMTIDAGLDLTPPESIVQTVVLARKGELAAFASSATSFDGVLLPSLADFGIALADTGAICQQKGGCGNTPHGIRVTRGTDIADVAAGFTARVGDLSFMNGETIDLPACHVKTMTQLGGFRPR
jgi:hypothetical protein